MKKIWIAVIAPPAVVLFVWLFGELVMHLWNWLLPPLFGFHMITFWQTLGILLLSRILFGSWSGGGGNRRGRRREKWEKMTPEERERLRQSGEHDAAGFRARRTRARIRREFVSQVSNFGRPGAPG